jgi:allantoate deiminase
MMLKLTYSFVLATLILSKSHCSSFGEIFAHDDADDAYHPLGEDDNAVLHVNARERSGQNQDVKRRPPPPPKQRDDRDKKDDNDDRNRKHRVMMGNVRDMRAHSSRGEDDIVVEVDLRSDEAGDLKKPFEGGEEERNEMEDLRERDGGHEPTLMRAPEPRTASATATAEEVVEEEEEELEEERQQQHELEQRQSKRYHQQHEQYQEQKRQKQEKKYKKVTDKRVVQTPEKKQLEEYLDHVLEDQPVRRLNVLGTFSDAAGHLERQFLSKASMDAHSKIKEWMADAGLRVFTDAAGNIHGVLDATSAPALDEHGQKMIRKEMFIGSHLDTVIDGGKFDGALGVVVGIAAAKALRRTNPIREYNIHIIGFSDEEGVRFGSTFLGSRAIVGTLPDDVFEVVDKQGATFLQALRNAGLPGTRESILEARLPRQSFGAYVEVHIEQGKVLELGGFAVAAVAGIAGQTRLKVTIHGVQGHAGTTPMVGRRDSTPAAAEAVLEIEKRCKKGGIGEALPEVMLVCTVGEFEIFPGATNVIGSKTVFAVDIRAQSDRVRKNVVQDVTRKVQLICRARGLECKVARTHEASGVTMDRKLTKQLEDSCDRTTEEMHRRAYNLYMEQQRLEREETESGHDNVDDDDDVDDDEENDFYDDIINDDDASDSRRRRGGGNGRGGGHKNKRAKSDEYGFTREPVITRPPTLVSGAGHDALAMADAMPVGMLFVRSKDGISHSSQEYTSPEDIGMSARVLYRFLQSFTFPEDDDDEEDYY